ncbi:MAG: hypothetical protein KAX57_15125, partial [Rhodoferax sp.]|nr:hypothetical protein [Rhodoferax sp.]
MKIMGAQVTGRQRQIWQTQVSIERFAMDFEYSPKVQALRQNLEAFIERFVLPYNGAWHRSVAQG